MKKRKQQKKKLKNIIRELYYTIIRRPIYRLKSFIECNIIERTTNVFSRAIKGYSFRDVWDFENWFVRIIPKMLEEVKNRSPRGVPLLENGDIDNSVRHVYRGSEGDEWHKILDTIIDEFKYTQKYYNYDYDESDIDADGMAVYNDMKVHRDNAFKLLYKYFDYYGW